MAWPPPVLPINRTNANPQLDTHPADHNAVNLAVNDIVPELVRVGNRADALAEWHLVDVYTGAQAIANNVYADLVWQAASADTDGYWVSGPLLTIPPGMNGYYVVTAKVTSDGVIVGAVADVIIYVNATRSFPDYVPVGKQSIVVTAGIWLSVGDTVKVGVFNGGANPTNWAANCEMTFIKTPS